MDYWTAFIDYIHERDSAIKTGKPHDWHYLPFPIGRANVALSPLVYAKDKRIAMQLYFHGPNAISYFEQIKAEKEEIEKEIGENLVWDHTQSTSRDVIIFKDNEDIKNTTSWPEQHKWFYENLEAFYKVFAERVKNLSSDYLPEDNVNFPNDGQYLEAQPSDLRVPKDILTGNT